MSDEPKLIQDLQPDWVQQWIGMPDFKMENLQPWQSISVHFANMADREKFAKLVKQTISHRTRSIWYPRAEIGHFADRSWKSSLPTWQINPRYPIYIISKGRWKTRMTSKALEKMGVPYNIVVEPQEFKNYAHNIDPAKIIQLPKENYGQGCSIPARNFVWKHARKRGAERHWILDDNIEGFFRLHNNLKVPVDDGSTFRAAEDFTDRYENVALSGFNYFMFAPRKSGDIQPYSLNTRIYSCILVKNDLPYGWRGRYNEDTDLSLRALKDGWCTILFNVFLAFKQTTMTQTGGNTESLYVGVPDGRLKMAESLKEMHPEHVTITRKWDRWQHHVDYSVFKQTNRLKLKPDLKLEKIKNNYGMELKIVEEKRKKIEAAKLARKMEDQ
jgi:hypothetical protein